MKGGSCRDRRRRSRRRHRRRTRPGFTLDLPPEQRVEGTAATIAVGIVRGADIIRVHDVKEMARVARMTDAIVRRNY